MAAESSTASVPTTGPSPSSAAAPVSQTKDKRPSRYIEIVPAVVALLAAVLFFSVTGNWNSWTGGRAIQETDDAYVRADLTPLALPRV